MATIKQIQENGEDINPKTSQEAVEGLTDSLNNKEDKANKVSAFQETPSDDKYPTEKLVYDKCIIHDTPAVDITLNGVVIGHAQIFKDGGNLRFVTGATDPFTVPGVDGVGLQIRFPYLPQNFMLSVEIMYGGYFNVFTEAYDKSGNIITIHVYNNDSAEHTCNGIRLTGIAYD